MDGREGYRGEGTGEKVGEEEAKQRAAGGGGGEKGPSWKRKLREGERWWNRR